MCVCVCVWSVCGMCGGKVRPADRAQEEKELEDLSSLGTGQGGWVSGSPSGRGVGYYKNHWDVRGNLSRDSRGGSVWLYQPEL